jgi:hypothetical protein
MEATLDMNSNRIINLPAPISDAEPLRLGDLEETDGITSFPFSLLTGKPTTLAGYGITDPIRIKQTAATTYYVRATATGDTGRTGLANTDADAFLTIQGILNYLYKSVDFGSFSVIINVGAGTFAPFSIAHPWIGGSFPHIVGAGIGSTIIAATANSQSLVSVTDMSVLDVSALSLSAGGFTGVVGLDSTQAGILDFGTISFGAMDVGIRVNNEGAANQTGNLTITGNLSAFAQALHGGGLRLTSTITVNGGLTIDYFLNVQYQGVVNTSGAAVTFAGAGAGAGTTGTKFITSNDGRIDDSGTTWPGATAGTKSQVDGPSATVVDNSVVRWDGTTGNIIQGSTGTTISDAGNVATIGSIKSSSASSGIGYATGAGSTVTQLTNKATAVTINSMSGQITMNNAALGAGSEVGFTVNNSGIASTDCIMVNHQAIGTGGAYMVQAYAITAGSFAINVTNLSAGSLSEAIVLNFVVIKGVTS